MNAIESLAAEGIVERDVPLGPLTTYKLGGPAAYFADVSDRGVLLRIAASGAASELPVLVLGRGSNLVVADDGFAGLVIRLGAGFSQLEVSPSGPTVKAGGSHPLPKLARAVLDHGLTGLEFFVGVPGSVGGAVRQNAGCFGRETRDCLVSADVIDLLTGESKPMTADDLDLSYRHSNLSPTQIVVSAVFELQRGDLEAAREEMKRITRWRRDNQPGGTLNAGSVFKNPPDVSAGELIDRLGLKGTRCGDVSVSEKHANFFVAGPEATSADIARLVTAVKDRVFELSGTKLEPEIQFVGFDQ